MLETGCPTPQAERAPELYRPRRESRLVLALCDRLEQLLARFGARRFYCKRNLRAGRFHVRLEDVHVPKLPRGLDGLTIAHLSDLHAGSFLRSGDLRQVVEHVNDLEVDLVALTGDYVSHRATDAELLAEDLAALRSRWGTFAVLGNHDYRGGQESTIVDCFSDFGVRFLRNRGLRLDSGHGVLYLSGVEDLEEGSQVDAVAARSQLQAGDVEVMLCHHPEGARQFARKGCVLMLSGHTHGGQLNLRGVPRPGPHHPGNRVQHGTTACIVSRGLGAVALPVRYRAPAEVIIVTLRGA